MDARIVAIIERLPVTPASRIIEIGCGPGVAARAIAAQLTTGHLLATDRSSKAIAQVTKLATAEIADGRLSTRQVSAEELALLPDEKPYDFAFANRVGALDGRHPHLYQPTVDALRRVLTSKGRLFVDGVEFSL